MVGVLCLVREITSLTLCQNHVFCDGYWMGTCVVNGVPHSLLVTGMVNNHMLKFKRRKCEQTQESVRVWCPMNPRERDEEKDRNENSQMNWRRYGLRIWNWY